MLRVIALLLALICAQSAWAYDDYRARARAVAFADYGHPDNTPGVCFDIGHAATVDCALAQCAEANKIAVSECEIATFCHPHGWVVQIFAKNLDGPEGYRAVCGLFSPQQIDMVVRDFCDSPAWLDCHATRIWNPEGESVDPRG